MWKATGYVDHLQDVARRSVSTTDMRNPLSSLDENMNDFKLYYTENEFVRGQTVLLSLISNVLKTSIRRGSKEYTLIHIESPKHAAEMVIELSHFNIDSSWSDKPLVSESESEVKLPPYIRHYFNNCSNLELVGMVNASEELMLKLKPIPENQLMHRCIKANSGLIPNLFAVNLAFRDQCLQKAATHIKHDELEKLIGENIEPSNMHIFLTVMITTFDTYYVPPVMLTAFMKCADHIEALPETFDMILLIQCLIKWNDRYFTPWEYKDVDALKKWVDKEWIVCVQQALGSLQPPYTRIQISPMMILLQTIPNDVPILNVDLIVHLISVGNPYHVGIIPLIFTNHLNHYAEMPVSSNAPNILSHIFRLVEGTKSPHNRHRNTFAEFDLYALELMNVITNSKPSDKTEKEILDELKIYDNLLSLAHKKQWLDIPFQIIVDERMKKIKRMKRANQ